MDGMDATNLSEVAEEVKLILMYAKKMATFINRGRHLLS